MSYWNVIGAGVLGVTAGLAGLHFSPYLAKKRSIAALRVLCRKNRWLSLTYDDGPGRELTSDVLRLLGRYNARATFFLLGRRVTGAEDVVERIKEAGHELGCHSQRHLNAWEVMPGKALRDVRDGYQTLERWMGSSAIYRPPYGKLVYTVSHYLKRHRAPLGWWTEDSGDTHMDTPPMGACAERIKQSGGGVVLLHDFDRDDGGRRDFVTETTESLLRLAQDEGLTIVTLGEILRRQRESTKNG